MHDFGRVNAKKGSAALHHLVYPVKGFVVSLNGTIPESKEKRVEPLGLKASDLYGSFVSFLIEFSEFAHYVLPGLTGVIVLREVSE